MRWRGSAARAQALLSVVRHPVSGLGPQSAANSRPAFTLVELLVVISIIGLLMGIIVPTYFSIREKAKYTKAKVTVKNLETAFKSYLDHYRVWPSEFGDGNAPKKIDENVVSILRGENSDHLAFYEFDTTNSAGAFLDPFTTSEPNKEQPYRFLVDANYDNKISVGGQDIYRTVIVWSVGTNRLDELSESPAKEGNIKSWD